MLLQVGVQAGHKADEKKGSQGSAQDGRQAFIAKGTLVRPLTQWLVEIGAHAPQRVQRPGGRATKRH